MSRFKEFSIISRKNTSVALGILAICMLMASPLTISTSYAMSENQLEWKLIFIQEAECNQTDNLDKVYSSLTSKYFEMYELENISLESKCMNELEYSNYQMDENIDLLILVYDGKIGEKILEPNKVDGLYIHSGNDRTKNHVVIMCHCSDFDSGYEQILPSWILTHELSHFILSYKGFPRSIVQSAIHEIEKEYDNCIGTNFQSDYCASFKTTLRPDNISQDYPVMKPYEDAVGQKLVKYISDDFSDSNVINLQRDIAKMWITNEIDDNAYLKTLSNFIESPKNFEEAPHIPFLNIENGFIIAELSKPKDVTWDEYLKPELTDEDNSNLILNHVPFSLDGNIEELSGKEMPNWFKARALLWSEKRISDKVFFDGVEHLVRMGIVSIS